MNYFDPMLNISTITLVGLGGTGSVRCVAA